MAGKSNIEWTEQTWNPIVGCSILTPGCTNCYAMKMAARIESMKSSHYDGTTKRVKGNAVWTGKLALAPEHVLLAPLHRKKPTTYFVNSMGDLFHEDAPDEWIDKVFAVMALSPRHTFQVLTKRAPRMRHYLTMLGHISEFRDERLGMPKTCWQTHWPLPNVWLGVSAERQQEADERIPHLLQTPAAVRFISAEPLLGPIDLQSPGYTGFAPDGGPLGPAGTPRLDWVIVGGESGPGARPMHPDFARSLRDQCAAAGVAYFFKQWGAFGFVDHMPDDFSDPNKDQHIVKIDGESVEVLRRVGKAKAGRLLDGKTWDQMPKVCV